MTTQARNSINLYRGNDPQKIEMLLGFQNSSVVNELKAHFHVTDIHALAIALSKA